MAKGPPGWFEVLSHHFVVDEVYHAEWQAWHSACADTWPRSGKQSFKGTLKIIVATLIGFFCNPRGVYVVGGFLRMKDFRAKHQCLDALRESLRLGTAR